MVGIFYFLRNAPKDNLAPAQTEIIVNYNSKQAFSPKSYRVLEGQSAVIKATSDIADELHFHGYDLHVDLQANKEGDVSFKADKTGRFEFELESRKATLGIIEVYPK